MRVQGGGAVGTDDAEVLQAMVITDAIDVIQDQRHGLSVPQLTLTT
jgi:hypothetical protein